MTSQGLVPLRLITDHRLDDAMLMVGTEEGREELMRKDMDGELPLHRACLDGAPLELVEAILDSYPKAVRVTNSDGGLPLHLACLVSGFDISPGVVRLLLKAYPEGAKAADDDLRLPLHYAAGNKATFEVLVMLIDAHPEGVTALDIRGQLPLHHLDDKASPDKQEDVDKVKLLIQPLLDNEDACKAADRDCGRLALHIAAKFDLSINVIRSLLSTYGEAAKIMCRRKYKEGRKYNEEKSLYALDLLEGLRNELDSAISEFNQKSDVLFSFNPNILPYRKEKGRLQRFVELISLEAQERNLSESAQRVWIWMCTFENTDDPNDNYVPQINAILDRFGDRKTVEWLASFETPGVRHIREIAAPTCAKAINAHFLFAGRLELSRDPPMHKSATCIVVEAKDFGDSYDQRGGQQRGSDLNESNRVVVKFMSEVDQFQREIESRELRSSKRCSETAEQPFLVPCITYFDSRLPSKADAHYERDIRESANVFGHDLLCYPCAIVMQRADRNFDSIYRHEVPSMLKIRGYMEEVANILEDLHNTGKIHADIKLLNIVRLNNMLTLIDMDSHRIMESDDCGVKLSTGILPPEMFYELKTDEEEDQVVSYWEDVVNDFKTIEQIKTEANAEVPDAISDILAKGRGVETANCESKLRFYAKQSRTVNELLGARAFSVDAFYKMWARLRKNETLWKKIRPRSSKAGRKFLPRAFRRGCSANLPYDLVHASATIDIWSFGVLLYKLCTKNDLFESTDDTIDLSSGEAYSQLACWDLKETSCKEKIDRVENKVTRDLLTWLFSKDATERPKAMSQVLNHDFFRADYTVAKENLEREIIELNEKLKKLGKQSDDAADARKQMEMELQEKEEQLQAWIVSLSTLLGSRNWKALSYRVKNAPDSLPKRFLHAVCTKGPTLAVIDAIIIANEELVIECNGLGELPIHVACRHGIGFDVIERFVQLHPASILKSNALNKTPLDNAQTEEWTYYKNEQYKVVRYLRRECFRDHFDDMTGLPKTAALGKWASLPAPGFTGGTMFLLYIDISGFKAVNDNASHETGDNAIKQYAREIQEACEKCEASAKSSMHLVIDVFRPGGDEFVVAAKFAKNFKLEAAWTNMIKSLVESLAGLTFDDSKDPCRYCTFLRIGCCAGSISRMHDILEKAEELQGTVQERIGLDRGESVSLQNLRERGISNFSGYAELCEDVNLRTVK